MPVMKVCPPNLWPSRGQVRKAHYDGVMPSIAVAVSDSGVNPIPGRMLDGIKLTSRPSHDERGHGSKVAGTILTIAPSGQIVPIRVMDEYGALESPDLLDLAFRWVQQHAA